MRIVTPEEAALAVRSRDRVWVQAAAAAPQRLLAALTERHDELQGVEMIQLHTEGAAPYVDARYARSFHTSALFVGPNVRDAVAEGQADYLPIFLSEVPNLFRSGAVPLDVALVQVSPPDAHGYCSLGVSVEASCAAVQNARRVIAQVNPNMPRTHGDGLLHVSDIDLGVEVDDPIPEVAPAPLTPAARAIGIHCAALIEDGATLQMGIGAIPDAVLAALGITATWASTPRCSPTAPWTSSRRGSSPAPASTPTPARWWPASSWAPAASTTSSTTTRWWRCSTPPMSTTPP